MNPAPIRSVLSESEYDLARAKIRETYGDNRQQAGTRWEQELALLFYRSGWTQEQLAKKEGTSRPMVTRRLKFGQFLAFSENVPAGTKPKLEFLAERQFRDLWLATDQTEPNDRVRFAAVARALEDYDPALRRRPRAKIGQAIKEQFADGKWRSVNAMAKRLDADEDHVLETLRVMQAHETYNAKCEQRKVGRDFEYRIFPKDNAISSSELREKLTPIIEGLKAEGKKNMATMSPGTVAYLAAKLDRLLDGWTE